MSSFVGPSSGNVSSAIDALVNNPYTIFVGKHGSDSNSGKAWSSAFLTFNKAMDAVSAGDVVLCLDSGTYNERIDIPDGVAIRAPEARFTTSGGGGYSNGAFEFLGDGYLDVGAINVTGEPAVLLNGNTGTAHARAKIIDCGANGWGFLNYSFGSGGVLIAHCNTLRVGATSVGVGHIDNTSVGHIHVDIEDIYLYGTDARGFANGQVAGSAIVGNVSHILELGTVTDTLAIDVNTGVINLNVRIINTDRAWQVSAGATLNIFVNSLTGSQENLGTTNATTP